MSKLKDVGRLFSLLGIIAAMVLMPGMAAAEDQPGESSEKKEWVSPFFSPKVGSLYFLGGAGFNDLDGLNGRMGDAGYSDINTPTLSLGLGTDMSIGRLILGAEWQRLRTVGTEAERDDIRADISAKYWLFRVGVDVAKWRGLRVYPLVGIGTGTSKFTVATESGASFDDVLDAPTRDLRMTQKGLVLDASLGVDYRFKMRETEYKSSFFTVGVRGGYLFAPYSRGWETASAEISGGPDLMTSGPTVQLLLGFSGERKKPWWHKSAHHKK
jgi:opacity protein-like surface antigen